jgi:hypothetical protein
MLAPSLPASAVRWLVSITRTWPCRSPLLDIHVSPAPLQAEKTQEKEEKQEWAAASPPPPSYSPCSCYLKDWGSPVYPPPTFTHLHVTSLWSGYPHSFTRLPRSKEQLKAKSLELLATCRTVSAGNGGWDPHFQTLYQLSPVNVGKIGRSLSLWILIRTMGSRALKYLWKAGKQHPGGKYSLCSICHGVEAPPPDPQLPSLASWAHPSMGHIVPSSSFC